MTNLGSVSRREREINRKEGNNLTFVALGPPSCAVHTCALAQTGGSLRRSDMSAIGGQLDCLRRCREGRSCAGRTPALTSEPGAFAAGVREAPRHEIAEGGRRRCSGLAMGFCRVLSDARPGRWEQPLVAAPDRNSPTRSREGRPGPDDHSFGGRSTLTVSPILMVMRSSPISSGPL